LVVEYSLTSLGTTLTEPLGAIREWAERNIDSILEARRRFERHSRGGDVDK
jgi:DNA-binding HxlR family transcriptional regulator